MDWVNKVKPSIIERINLYATNEIKFNLLSIVPDRRLKFEEEIADCSKRIEYIQLMLNKEDTSEILLNNSFLKNYDDYSEDLLNSEVIKLGNQLEDAKAFHYEEVQKLEKYRIENKRRQHNYIPLIFEMLKVMSEKNVLEDIYKQAKVEEEEHQKKLKESKSKENEKEKEKEAKDNNN